MLFKEAFVCFLNVFFREACDTLLQQVAVNLFAKFDMLIIDESLDVFSRVECRFVLFGCAHKRY